MPDDCVVFIYHQSVPNRWPPFNCIVPAEFNADKECAVALHLNIHHQIVSFELLSIGTKYSVLVHRGETFRAAIVANAAAIVLVHNHPSGDPTPSEADIKVTRDIIRVGEIIGVDLLDSIIVGHPGYTSLRADGYFYKSDAREGTMAAARSGG